MQTSDLTPPALVNDKTGKTLRTAGGRLVVGTEVRPEDEVIQAANATMGRRRLLGAKTMVYVESIPASQVLKVKCARPLLTSAACVGYPWWYS
jgi:hypothetical protein